MIWSILLSIAGIYLSIGLSLYAYAVVTTYQYIGVWDFKIRDGNVGICKLPKIYGWMERVSNKLGKRSHDE